MNRNILAVCLLLVLIVPTYAYSQSECIKGFTVNKIFGYYADYDFDVKKITSKPIEAYIKLLIKIGDHGTGMLVTYVDGQKTIYTIQCATLNVSTMVTSMECINDKNQIVPAGVQMSPDENGNYSIGSRHYQVSQVWINNYTTNTAIVFYN